MKVNPKTGRLMKVNETRSKTEKPGRADAGKTGKPVEISSLASELADIEEAAMKSPDIRTEKVEQLKQKIENGTYKIDEDKLAEILSRFI